MAGTFNGPACWSYPKFRTAQHHNQSSSQPHSSVHPGAVVADATAELATVGAVAATVPAVAAAIRGRGTNQKVSCQKILRRCCFSTRRRWVLCRQIFLWFHLFPQPILQYRVRFRKWFRRRILRCRMSLHHRHCRQKSQKLLHSFCRNFNQINQLQPRRLVCTKV